MKITKDKDSETITISEITYLEYLDLWEGSISWYDFNYQLVKEAERLPDRYSDKDKELLKEQAAHAHQIYVELDTAPWQP